MSPGTREQQKISKADGRKPLVRLPIFPARWLPAAAGFCHSAASFSRSNNAVKQTIVWYNDSVSRTQLISYLILESKYLTFDSKDRTCNFKELTSRFKSSTVFCKRRKSLSFTSSSVGAGGGAAERVPRCWFSLLWKRVSDCQWQKIHRYQDQK